MATEGRSIMVVEETEEDIVDPEKWDILVCSVWKEKQSRRLIKIRVSMIEETTEQQRTGEYRGKKDRDEKYVEKSEKETSWKKEKENLSEGSIRD